MTAFLLQTTAVFYSILGKNSNLALRGKGDTWAVPRAFGQIVMWLAFLHRCPDTDREILETNHVRSKVLEKAKYLRRQPHNRPSTLQS